MERNRNGHFRSSSLPLATFLFAKEQEIDEIQTTDGFRKEFLFVRTPLLAELVDAYKFGKRDTEDVMVDARLLERARQDLLDRVHE